MKDELKTLKDIIDGGTWYDGRLGIGFQNLLKQEAIKWYFYKYGSNVFENQAVAKFIKEFFNLEEDLK